MLKRQSRSIAALGMCDERYEDRARRQYDCAGWLVFREVVAGDLEGETRLHAAKFCGQRVTCPACGARRAGRLAQAYAPRLQTVKSETPQLQWYFATGTVRNGSDLAERFDVLDRTAKRWRETLSKQRRRKSGDLQNVEGGLCSFETKRSSRAGEWHPHVHVLIASKGRLDWSALRAAWLQASGGESQYFHTSRLWCDRLVREGKLVEGSDQYHERQRGDLCEVIKYPLKFEAGAEAETWPISDVLAGRTLSRPFGCLWGVQVPDSLVDDPLDWDALTWIERWFKYQAAGHAYSETQAPSRCGPALGEIVGPQKKGESHA